MFSHRKSRSGLIASAIAFVWVLAPLRAQDAPFVIEPQAPAVIFPESDLKSFKLTLKSNKFEVDTGGNNATNLVTINERSFRIVNVVPKDSTDSVKGEFTTHRLVLTLPWSDIWSPQLIRSGANSVSVTLAGIESNETSISVSGVNNAGWPFLLGLSLTGAILGGTLLMLKFSKQKVPYTVAGRSYGVLATLFLDKETDTYSLSKFQLYAWTAAAVLGYLVLTFAKSLIQGHFEFAEVPNGLPGILLVSAGTTAGSLGITSAKGAKGAGAVYPGLADFVSSGGLIVPDRFQFFIWTIVGVFTFLFVILGSDPTQLKDLPLRTNTASGSEGIL